MADPQPSGTPPMTLSIPDSLIDAARTYDASPNETEIVQKLLLPFLTVLGYGPDDYVPEQYTPMANFGKGETRRQGFRPDCLIRLDSLFLVVIEAKNATVDVLTAWREAHGYAQELNRNSADRSAIEVVVGFNGREVATAVVGTPDSDVSRQSFRQLLENVSAQGAVEALLLRERLSERAAEVRLNRGGANPSSVRARLYHSANVPRDEGSPLTRAFEDLLSTYFSELANLNDDDFRTGYCDPNPIGLERPFENVVRDRPPAGTHAANLTRTTLDSELVRRVRKFHDANLEAAESLRSVDRFILVLGDAGAGKSTLLEWFRRFYHAKDGLCIVQYIGSAGPQDAAQLYNRLLDRVIATAEEHFYRPEVSERESTAEAIQDILSPCWKKEYEEFYRHMQKAEYLTKYFPTLAKDVRQDKAKYLKLIIAALRRKRVSVCVLLDNLDTTGMAMQIEGFRTLRPFAEEFDVCCVMTLREETYKIHENAQPINAFRRGPVLHVPAPTAADVIDKRLWLVEQKFAKSDHAIGSYPLTGGITFNITRRSAVRVLRAILNQLRVGEHQLSLIDGICGPDMRKALDAFRAVSVSSRIDEEARRAVHDHFNSFFPSYDSIVKALVCGEWRHYCKESPLVANVYRPVQGTNGSSVLYTLRLLRALNKHSADTHGQGKGFVDLATLRGELSAWLDVQEMPFRRLIFELHSTDVWQVNTFKPSNATDFDFVKLRPHGLFLLLSLYKESAYLDSMAFDTTIDEQKVLDQLTELVRADMNAAKVFRAYLSKRESEETSRVRARGLDDFAASSRFFADGETDSL